MIYLKFNNKFNKQKSGFPMGNPLSGVLACLFLEILESGPFKYRLLSNAIYFRYIDNILIFLPQKCENKKDCREIKLLNPPLTLQMKKNQITPYSSWTS